MIIRKLKSQRGAMDKILVTLLLLIVAVTITGTLGTWFQGEYTEVHNAADQAIQNAVSQ